MKQELVWSLDSGDPFNAIHTSYRSRTLASHSLISRDTIFALSSAPGRAGVAVVRLSGSGSGPALRTLTGEAPAPRRAALRDICDPESGEVIDRGLILWFPAPNSFTGEDCAEFQIHGGKAVISKLLEVLAHQPGLRLAEAGEFARRAFTNGKLDLTAAEGLADLIDAETEGQRRQAVRQAGGRLAQLYEGWRRDLIAALALQEAGIDFSDEEDIAADASAQAESQVATLLGAVKAHLNDGNRGEILRSGFEVVIAGPPNAGKSSLLNALAKRDVAIVSEEAGTTRDILEVRLDLDGIPVTVADTAGLREALGKVEQEGIRRALARAKNSHVVIWLQDATAAGPDLPPALEGSGAIGLPVFNKIDLLKSPRRKMPALGDAQALMISTVTGQGLTELIARLAQMARDRIGSLEEPAITRQRHRCQLYECQQALQDFLAGEATDIELRAEDLRRAALALGRITGNIDVEDVLDQIFSSFCIGK